MSRASVRTAAQWDRALAASSRLCQVSLTDDQWDVFDACYGDEWVPRISGLSDYLLEVAFLRAIDLAGDTP